MKKYIWIVVIILLLMTGCQADVNAYTDIAPNSIARETDTTASANEQVGDANSPYDNLDIPKSYSIPDIVCPLG